MPVTIKTADSAKLEELLGKHRYYSELLAVSPLLTAEALSIFTEQMETANGDSSADDDEDDDGEGFEFEDDSEVILADIDDTERKQLDGALRTILARRIAKIDIELKKLGVTLEA